MVEDDLNSTRASSNRKNIEIGGISGVSGGSINIAGGDIYIQYPELLERVITPGKSPFPGLDYFDIDRAQFFFGRSDEIIDLYDLLNPSDLRTRFISVVGPSGSGKSSLVRAGLVNYVQIREPERWIVVPPFVPGKRPVGQLARAIEKATITHSTEIPFDYWKTVQTELQKSPEKFVDYLWRLLRSSHLDGKILLIVDQFEELVTRSDNNSMKCFADIIKASLDVPDSPLSIVVTLRSDFVTPVLQSTELQNILRKSLLLPSIGRDRLGKVIKGPAEVAGLNFEAGLIQRMVADTGQGEALPLLAFTLREMYEKLKGKNQFDHLIYDAVGGINGALTKQAERVITLLEEMNPAAVEHVFPTLLKLVTINEDNEPAKKRVPLDMLSPIEMEIVQAFVQARLLRTEDENDVQVVGVTHETLFRVWEPFEIIINDSREDLRIHREINRSAQQWIRRNQDDSYLLSGTRLDRAKEWAEKNSKQMNVDEKNFFDASLDAFLQESRAIQRRKMSIISVITTAVLMITVAVTLALTGQLNRFIYRPIALDWVEIPAGEFTMGNIVEGDIEFYPSEKPPHTVYLDTYLISRFEITNRQYGQCVKAGVCRPPAFQEYTYEDYANNPITYVSWEDADTFCRWTGGRLPTEAEWEKAARGSDYPRLYPWGEALPECDLVNYSNCVANTAPVGSYSDGASPYGVMDMAGNASEWVSDWYDENYYQDSPLENPAGPNDGTGRVVRGGAWFDSGWLLRVTTRISNNPATRDSYNGIRCVHEP